jgi:hypothetical protein
MHIYFCHELCVRQRGGNSKKGSRGRPVERAGKKKEGESKAESSKEDE